MRVDGRIRFEYATYGRGNFLIRKEKVADSKISGYAWTGPEKTVAVQVRYKSLYISMPSPTKQQREVTKFRVVYGTWTA